MKQIITAIALSLFPLVSLAQTPAPSVQRPYDVLSYHLTMDWRPVFENQTTRFSGNNQILVQILKTTPLLVLNAAEMRIDSVTINGQIISTPIPGGDTVAIPLTKAEQSPGTQLTLDVYYTRTSAAEDGMYYYPKETYVGLGPKGDSVFTTENLAYTMSEPTDARKWMPCNDAPYDKANSAVSIIVPAAYSAQSNGTLQSVDTNSDGSRTFNWVSDRPIATYLMCGDASIWATWHDYYHRLSNPNDSVPVVYYVWPSDSSSTDTTGLTYNGRHAFRNTPRMIANDSRLFGEYPFKQYGQIALQPFGYGGMEHQTMTSLYRYVLRGTDEDVIAHELFHQWFGDKTTCETWADIWLNEGFATLGEALWEEYAHGENAYDNVILGDANYFLNPGPYYRNNIPTYNPPVDSMFGQFVPVVYWKPGCMLHMLRRVLNNDTLFFNTLKDYSTTFAYSTANSFQFRDFIARRDSALSPIDLKDFINEWVFQPDYPIYTIQWWVTNGTTLSIRVDQSQDSTDHYIMPLRFFAMHGQDTTDLVFINNARSQIFTTQLQHPIDTLFFDQEAIPISQYTMTHTADEAVGQTTATPEPLRVFLDANALKLTYAPIVCSNATLSIVDMLGRTINEIPLNHGSSLSVIPASSWANGDYLVVLRDGAQSKTVKFQWMR